MSIAIAEVRSLIFAVSGQPSPAPGVNGEENGSDGGSGSRPRGDIQGG